MSEQPDAHNSHAGPGAEPVVEIVVPDVPLVDPQLDSAEISPEVAQNADLGRVVAEAAKVEQEAEATGTLVGGTGSPRTDRRVGDGSSRDPQNSWRQRPAAPDAPEVTLPPLQTVARAHDAPASAQASQPTSGNLGKVLFVCALLLVILVLVGLLIWVVSGLFTDSSAAAPLLPAHYQAGP